MALSANIQIGYESRTVARTCTLPNTKSTYKIVCAFCGGQRWIRTTEGENRQIYSLLPLAARQPPRNIKLKNGAGDWNRTHNLLITSQLLCLLSYASILYWCLGAESNHRHGDFQSPALPTELPRRLKKAGIKPAPFHWRPGRGSNPRPLA